MFRPPMMPAARGRSAWIVVGFVVGICSAATLLAQSAPSQQPPQQPPQQPAQQAQAAPTTRVFASDAGMVLNFIKPDKTSDF